MRRPRGVRNLSDQAPTGRLNEQAAILSSVIKKPTTTGERPNFSERKMGTKALYTPQMTLTSKKAKAEQEGFAVVQSCCHVFLRVMGCKLSKVEGHRLFDF